ncbi:putative DNA replication complex GINS protein PSF2 [Chionoecetes opilio]|uniref:DNA replication complex GINS protein PSF2 n=1 Tax=Chionoecetes opilio TaxID=41210 RepID=A0A8J5CZ22_CHIOP|nr:putative DNA replication complex GINS protein PSF2 [Chionoecetes opilio]
MDSAHIEFLAEKLPISIVPNFTHEKLYLIAGDVGPFTAGIPVEVPLWLAIDLCHRRKCRLIMPDWMDHEKLAEIKEEETQATGFTKMPCEHYMAVAQLLLSAEPEGIPDSQRVKTLLKDIWDLRMSKLQSSVANFIVSGGSYAKLDQLTLMEINSIRPLLPHSLDQLHRLARSSNTSELSQTQDL